MKKILSFLIFLVIVIQLQAQQLPRVIILATGGTIAGAGASADRAGYTAGKIPIDDLIGAIPTVKKIANITGEQIASVGSQDMTIDIWKKLAIRINEIFKNKEADGIVITHGTDTQEETAYFLDLVVTSDNRLYLPVLCVLQQPSVQTVQKICMMQLLLLLILRAKAGAYW